MLLSVTFWTTPHWMGLLELESFGKQIYRNYKDFLLGLEHSRRLFLVKGEISIKFTISDFSFIIWTILGAEIPSTEHLVTF